MSDETLAGAEARDSFSGGERVPSEQAEYAVRLGGVQRSYRAIEMAAENGHRAVRDLPWLQFAPELLSHGRLGVFQPVDVAPLGLEPLQALGHLVRLPGQIAHLIAADDRDGRAEVARAETAKREVGHAVQHLAADPERQQEHHHEASDAEAQAHA